MKKNFDDKRINSILKLIMKYAKGELHERLSLSGKQDELDAIISGLNMLGEELLATTISKDYINRILDSLIESLIVLSPDKTIVSVNPAALKLLEYQVDDLVGRNMESILNKDYPENNHCIEELVNNGVSHNVEVIYSTSEGKKVPVLFSGSVIKDQDGNVEGIVCVAQDITSRKAMEESLKASQDSFARAQQIANLGNWDWNITNNELYWSDEIYHIFGLKPGEFHPSYEMFIESVHPEDREMLEGLINRAVQENEVYSVDHRIVLPDGDIRVVHEQGEVYYTDSNKPYRMVGTVQDITERRRVEEELHKYQETLEDLVAQRTIELNSSLDQLRREVNERKTIEQELMKHRHNLEDIVKERTEELSSTVESYRNEMSMRLNAEIALKSSHETLSTILNSLDAAVYVSDMKSYEILFVNR
ncbi:MAG: PAS domain-containing protein, partial [Spirochaetota bacterium]|nr:PAS domain-containing protein [Spirochaetota bacterium]